MSSLRPLATIVLLAVVGYVLYLKINQPEPELPTGAATRFEQGPIAEPRVDIAIPLPAADSGGSTNGVEEAPQFGANDPANSAPPLFEAAPPPWQPPAAGVTNDSNAGSMAQESRPPAPAASPAQSNAPSSGLPATMPPLPALPPPHAAVPAELRPSVPPPTESTPITGAGTAANVTGLPNNANTLTTPPPTVTPSTPLSMFGTARIAIDAALRKGEFAQAHLFLTQWHDDPSLTVAEKQYVANLLSQLAGTVIYSTDHHLEPPYIVQPQETLIDIAQKYQVPWQLLAKINGIRRPNDVQPGQTLKVVHGPFLSIVDLSDGELTLMLDGRYAGKFPVTIGSDATHSAGQWVVDEKLRQPAYVTRSQVLSASDPSNPLGDRMLVLTNSLAGGVKVGIHGPAARTMPGESRGYIRLSEQGVNDVFDILSVGSRVIIRK